MPVDEPDRVGPDPDGHDDAPDHGTPDPGTADPGTADPGTPDPTGCPGSAPRGGSKPGHLSRRRFVTKTGVSGAAFLIGGAGAHGLVEDHRPSPPNTAHATDYGDDPTSGPGGHGVGGSLTGERVSVYGHGVGPPSDLDEGALAALTFPPPPDGQPAGTVREHTIDVVEVQAAVAQDAEGQPVVIAQWTYDGTAPGPILRATEGDELRLTVRNRTGHPHNLHLHGRHDPTMDGWEPIPPGEEFTYVITAGPYGLHPYHCHTAPLARHLARGLYGMLIIDPPGGRPPATEVGLVLSGWDLTDAGRNDVYAWNGVAGFYQRHPITVEVGKPIRAYVVNMTEYDPIGSFHLHAQTFDVIRSGTALGAHYRTDTIALSQGERAIIEFTLDQRGRYMFHPHQHHMAERGAMGWFSAV